MRALFILPFFLAACPGSPDDNGADTDAGPGAGTDADAGADADGGDTDAGTEGGDTDAGTDVSTDAGADPNDGPLAMNSVRFTVGGHTSIIDCADTYDAEADYAGEFYQVECWVANDQSGTNSYGGAFILKLFNPEVRAYTAEDLARYSTGGFSLMLSRSNGTAPGTLLTSSGYPESAASFSDVDVAITVRDMETQRIATDFSFTAADGGGRVWNVAGLIDQVFVPQ